MEKNVGENCHDVGEVRTMAFKVFDLISSCGFYDVRGEATYA